MKGLAIAAPVLSGRVDDFREFSRDLHEGPNHSDYADFIKKSGLLRVRCWVQESPEGARKRMGKLRN